MTKKEEIFEKKRGRTNVDEEEEGEEDDYPPNSRRGERRSARKAPEERREKKRQEGQKEIMERRYEQIEEEMCIKEKKIRTQVELLQQQFLMRTGTVSRVGGDRGAEWDKSLFGPVRPYAEHKRDRGFLKQQPRDAKYTGDNTVQHSPYLCAML
mmetsp:Transcript_36417/g.94687  ORF Transcript_36417/g.94687 Transcript_36417/m.94687 type:complete len:154 (-) Transcript_36417:278-739(-)